MTTKARVRFAAAVIISLAIVFPVAAYGWDSDEPDPASQVDSLVALGTSFSFQGRLTDSGAPATGAYDLNFYLYDAAAGGNQVGPVQTVGDVAVSAGLFTVILNFGDVFHGAQYFLEVQVRPGASAGAYTILTPREALGAVPNASYAAEAGSLLLPQINAAALAPGALLTISNTSTDVNAVAISGTTAGLGYGVSGFSPAGSGVYGASSTGVGVFGTSLSGPGGHFNSSAGNALEVDGPIHFGGLHPAAFIWVAAPATISGPTTMIDNPATNGNPTAILMVTQYWTSVYNDHEIGVFYTSGKWAIFNEGNDPMPANAKFNILVINQ